MENKPQNFQEWLATVPDTLTADALWPMEMYRLAVFAADIGWYDVTKLMKDRRTLRLADQLYRALGSIGANIAEGYSRGSGRDRARFYEYALGSGREARTWYFNSRRVLGEHLVAHRMDLLTQILRLLLNIIPQQRNADGVREANAEYIADNTNEPDDKRLKALLHKIPYDVA